MKATILSAAIEVLAAEGLNNWTVEEVAERAHCAKGLVNYHYRSKSELLARAASTLRDDRQARRLTALTTTGAAALDGLWATLVAEVESGWFAAWLAALSSPPPLHAAAKGADGDALAAAASAALGVELHPESTVLIPAALDGIQIQLLRGTTPETAEEAYHRFWVSILR